MRYECVSEIRDKTGLLIYKIKQEHKQTPATILAKIMWTRNLSTEI